MSFSESFDSNPRLTPREAEVEKLLTLGMSNREIAEKLNISGNTVQTHVHSVLKKRGLGRRGQVGREQNTNQQ